MAQLIKIRTAPKKWHLKKAATRLPSNFRISGTTLNASSQFDSDFQAYLTSLKEQAMNFKLAVKKGGQESFRRGQMTGQVKIATQIISLGGLWQMRAQQEAIAIMELAKSIAQKICGDSLSDIEPSESIDNVQQKIIDMFHVQLFVPESLLNNISASCREINSYFICDLFVAEEKLIDEARISVSCIDSEFFFDIACSNLNRVLQSAIRFISHEHKVI